MSILFNLRPRNRARIRAHIRATCRLSLGYVRKSTRPSAFTDLLPVSATLLRPRNQERIARRYPAPTFPRMPFIGRLCGEGGPPSRRQTTPIPTFPRLRSNLCGEGGPSSRRRWMRGYLCKSIFALSEQSICRKAARYLPQVAIDIRT